MNTQSEQPNRYAAPQAEVDDVIDDSEVGELAGRGERLGAIMLDGLIAGLAIYVPLIIGLGIVGIKAIIATAAGDRTGFDGVDIKSIIMGASIAGIGAITVLVVNIYYVVKNRQTIGKKLLGIKVVRTDGSQVSIARLFWLRNVVSSLPGAIPFLGYVYTLARYLFIFGEPRRCIHDYIADTIVVKA